MKNQTIQQAENNTKRKKLYCYGEYGNHVIACDYYITKECPNTCKMARNLKEGIIHLSKSGLDRFIDKWGEDWKTKETHLRRK